MSHDLFRNRMAYVGEKPWNRLGKKVPAGTSCADFLNAAGLDWQVELVPARGAKSKPPSRTHPEKRWSRYVIRRPPLEKEELEPVEFAMVSDRYVPLQNTEAFASFDPLLESGWAQLETAGALEDGQTVWVQARLRDDMEVQPGDTIERHLLLRNRHDGKGSVSIRFTPIRVVCRNTLTFAERSQPPLASVRHTVGMADTLKGVQAEVIKKEIEAFADRARRVFERMAKTELSNADRLDLLTELCGPPKEEDLKRPTRRKMVEQRLAAQLDRHNKASFDRFAANNSAWALYNAITWVEDERARTVKDKEQGLDRMWFGSGADNKAKAFDVIAAKIGADPL